MTIGSSFPQIRSAASNYSKEQALIDLAKAENEPKDAVENFKVISSSLQPGDDLKDGTDGFLRLLGTLGNGSTSSVQSYYRQIAREREAGEPISAATDCWLKINTAENDPKDAASGFSVVDQALRGGETRPEATSQYLRLVSLEGNGNTESVQSHYNLVHKSLRADESRTSGIDAFTTQFRAENDVKQSVQNYLLVDGSLKPGETRASATEQFVRILNTEGNGSTDQAQADYRAVDSKVDAQHNRVELTDSFLRLRASSKDPAAAREMFLLAH